MRISFKKFCLAYTLIMLAYLIVRAFVTEFLSDETATFWYFVYRGDFWGETIVWDAANHPLNSFLSHTIYQVVGDVRGWLRIFSVVSFLFYAWASYKLCLLYQRKSLQILAFVALNSIPFMMEYFAYMRGYGLSMGFFLVAIYQLISFAKEKTLKRVVYLSIFSWLAFAANLTLLNSVLLFFLIVLLIQLTYRKQLHFRTHIGIITTTFFLLLSMTPLVLFAFGLKEHGALYYSSLDGIWDMTGKTLSRYVLFVDHNILMYAFILLFGFIIWRSVLFLRNSKWPSWITSRESIYVILFFGNLFASVVLAIVLKVHYPEDRTGMYLVPLFLLLLFSLMEKVKYSEYALLFFPITFLMNMSVHSSVFTPDERVTDQFFQDVLPHIEKESTLGIYNTMFSNWHYMDSHQPQKGSVPMTNMYHSRFADILVTKTNIDDEPALYNEHLDSFYHVIAHEPASKHIAYKRNRKAQLNLIYTSDAINYEGQQTYFDILILDSIQKLTSAKNLKITVEGNLKIDSKKNQTDLVLSTNSLTESGENIERYIPYVYELAYQNQFVATEFTHNFLLENLTEKEQRIKIYLWSRNEKIHHALNNVRVKIYEIK